MSIGQRLRAFACRLEAGILARAAAADRLLQAHRSEIAAAAGLVVGLVLGLGGR